MGILITDTNEVAAHGAVERIAQGWLVDGAVYPADLTHVQDVAIPPELAGLRLSYADGALIELPPHPVEVDPEAYKHLRAAEYPPVTDYLDGIVKGDQAQVQAYIDACLAVKAKYPKPE